MESSTYLNILIPIVSLLIGFFLQNVTDIFRRRWEERVKVKRLIFDMLLIWEYYRNNNFSEFMDVYIQLLREKGIIQPENDIEEFKIALPAFLDNFVSKTINIDLNKLEKQYFDSIENIASSDPILAFRFRKQFSSIERYFEEIKSYEFLNSSSVEYHEDESMDKVISKLRNHFNMQISNDIANDISKLAWKVDIITYFRIKIFVNNYNKAFSVIDKNILSEYIDKTKLIIST